MMIKLRNPQVREDKKRMKLMVMIIEDYCRQYPEIINNEFCDYIIDYMESRLLNHMLKIGVNFSVNDNYMFKKVSQNIVLFEHCEQIEKSRIMSEMLKDLCVEKLKVQ